MRGRRGWVLLLLAAVFAMHGLQCAAADSGTTTAAHGTVHTTPAKPDPVLHGAGLGPVLESTAAMTAAAPAAVVAGSAIGMSLAAGHDSTPHAAGHLWAVCLAVLAAGLAAMLLVLTGRLAEFRLLVTRRTTGGSWAGLHPPRPPDLYSLCLMRI
ncbi:MULTISPECIES: DUF6153 family protein [unclassified Blastococcus]|uniref:DUF6153 family protein n=1 Tax=unclassified Blastococcus TaxID=2619396 RepID=UPI001073AFDC|nr:MULTISPECIES: DUF6153 family protein [unclassified Blastococcus]TFV51790.1 hypothetical protein E4P43_08925 [Blastococcus sp. TF02A_35]